MFELVHPITGIRLIERFATIAEAARATMSIFEHTGILFRIEEVS